MRRRPGKPTPVGNRTRELRSAPRVGGNEWLARVRRLLVRRARQGTLIVIGSLSMPAVVVLRQPMGAGLGPLQVPVVGGELARKPRVAWSGTVMA